MADLRDTRHSGSIFYFTDIFAASFRRNAMSKAGVCTRNQAGRRTTVGVGLLDRRGVPGAMAQCRGPSQRRKHMKKFIAAGALALSAVAFAGTANATESRFQTRAQEDMPFVVQQYGMPAVLAEGYR